MRKRLSRTEQVERNRGLVLDAALRVFLTKGYAGASLDAIAEKAGFSKGVVYSQFGAKADLFLALLEQRIADRSTHYERIVAETPGAEGVRAILRVGERFFQSEPAWTLLVLEFRVHAARDPELNRRYARAHERTLEWLAGALDAIHRRAGLEPAFAPRTMAELILAVGLGVELERTANPHALPMDALSRMLPLALGIPPAPSDPVALRAGGTRRKR